MGYTYVLRDGERVEANVAYWLDRMNQDFIKDTGCRLHVTSGTRYDWEQEDIFRARYVTAANVRGRYVYDTQWWQGQTWYRISPAGRVAVPKMSNHQEGGPNGPRSIDISDSGQDAGVGTRGTVRDLWMERNAWKYGFENEGYAFRNPVEAWHKTFRWLIGVPAPVWAGLPSTSAPAPAPASTITNDKESDMIVIELKIGTDLHYVALGEGHFAHLEGDDKVKMTADITGQDRIFSFGIDHLARLLRQFGCDRDIWDIRGGKFVVLDPLTGEVASGKTWTAERAIRGEIRGIAKPVIDPAPLIAAIEKAVREGRDYDAASIAKAVNDDAAARMRG